MWTTGDSGLGARGSSLDSSSGRPERRRRAEFESRASISDTGGAARAVSGNVWFGPSCWLKRTVRETRVPRPEARIDRQLRADNRAEPGLLCRFVEARRAVYAIRIEQCQRRIPECRGPFDESFRK